MIPGSTGALVSLIVLQLSPVAQVTQSYFVMNRTAEHSRRNSVYYGLQTKDRQL